MFFDLFFLKHSMHYKIKRNCANLYGYTYYIVQFLSFFIDRYHRLVLYNSYYKLLYNSIIHIIEFLNFALYLIVL